MDVNLDFDQDKYEDSRNEKRGFTFGRFGSLLLGILFVVGAAGAFYYEGTRKDLSDVAASSAVLDPAKPSAGVSDGALVSLSGQLVTSDKLTDGLYLVPGKFVAANRKVEVYAWQESKSDQRKKNSDGTTSVTATYKYYRDWTTRPDDSRNFKYPVGHYNPTSKLYDDVDLVAGKASIGVYALDMSKLKLPKLERVRIDGTVVRLNHPGYEKIVNDLYVFRSSGTYMSPYVGDLRISYTGLLNGADATVFGKLSNGAVTEYAAGGKSVIYNLYPTGNKDEAVKMMKKQFAMMTWLIRGIGLVLMWVGLIIARTAVADVAGKVSPEGGNFGGRFVAGAITFILAVLLSGVAMVVL